MYFLSESIHERSCQSLLRLPIVGYKIKNMSFNYANIYFYFSATYECSIIVKHSVNSIVYSV